MNLTHRQLARLRQHARQLHELELRHEARLAARTTQIDYLRTLRQQLDRLPQARAARLAAAATDAEHTALDKRFEADERRLTGEISAGQAELEGLGQAVSELSHVIGPHRELLERLLQAAGLPPASVGVVFGDDRRQQAGELVATIGGR